MFVSVQFHGTQRTITGVHEMRLPLPKLGRAGDILGHLRTLFPDIPLNEKEITVSINNKISTMNHTLNPGDNVSFLPHIGGG